MSDDCLAADAVACRIMGVNPGRVEYLKLAARPSTPSSRRSETQRISR